MKQLNIFLAAILWIPAFAGDTEVGSLLEEGAIVFSGAYAYVKEDPDRKCDVWLDQFTGATSNKSTFEEGRIYVSCDIWITGAIVELENFRENCGVSFNPLDPDWVGNGCSIKNDIYYPVPKTGGRIRCAADHKVTQGSIDPAFRQTVSEISFPSRE